MTTVTITPAAGLTLPEGGSGMLTATARDAADNVVAGTSFSWGSLDSTIATVSGTGSVTGQSTGLTQVLASANGKEDTVTIVVVAAACAGVGAVAQWQANLEFGYGNTNATPGGFVSAFHQGSLAATLLPTTTVLGKLEWIGELTPGPASDGGAPFPLKMAEVTVDTLSDPTERIDVTSDAVPVPTPGVDGFRLEIDTVACTFRFLAAPSVHATLKVTEHAVHTLPGPNEGVHSTDQDLPFGVIQKGVAALGDWRSAGMGVFANGAHLASYSVLTGVPPTLDGYTPDGVVSQGAFFDFSNPVPQPNTAILYFHLEPVRP
ncbi:MAG: Ig-like domain-containing protein [Gemmatimonadota bacterium]